MTFEELKAEIDASLAIIAWYRKGLLDDAIVSTLDFAECLACMNEAIAEEELREMMVERMRSVAASFSEWQECAVRSTREEERLECASKMADCAESFEDWWAIGSFFGDIGRELRFRVRRGLVETATTFNEWHRAFTYTKKDFVLNGEAMRGMAETAETAEEWRVIRESVDPDSEIYLHAAERSVETINDISECLRLYQSLPQGHQARKALERKIDGMESTSGQWLDIYRSAPRNSDLARLAQRQMSRRGRRVPAPEMND